MKKYIIPCSAAAAVSAACAVRICYEDHNFVTEDYVISSEKLPDSFDGFHFVLVSDLHNFDFDSGNKRLISEIERIGPDAVISAGDMVDAGAGTDTDNSVRFMRNLCDRWPVYFASGNHESKLRCGSDACRDAYIKWRRSICHKNLTVLNNRHISVPGENNEEHINIYGLEIGNRFYGRGRPLKMDDNYISDILGKCDRKSFNILIAHNPAYFENYASWGADLVLSGHVHGGVIILPVLGGVISPQMQLFPKYYSGLYECAGSSMVLSRGLHMHSIPVRFNNMPELSHITLKKIKC